MQQLTKSDQVNILTFKELLKTLQNDITDAKNNTSLAPGDKAREVFKITRQRAQLINNALNHYPQINWIDEALKGRRQSINRDLKFKELFNGLN